MIRPGNPVSSSHFTVYRDPLAPPLMVSEASTLEGHGMQLHQIYDDACDVGFSIRSERTGTILTVAQSRVERKDGDLLWTDYTPADARQQRTVVVRIYND